MAGNQIRKLTLGNECKIKGQQKLSAGPHFKVSARHFSRKTYSRRSGAHPNTPDNVILIESTHKSPSSQTCMKYGEKHNAHTHKKNNAYATHAQQTVAASTTTRTAGIKQKHRRTRRQQAR